MAENIAQRCAAYLQYRMPEATDVGVASVSQIFGGASCETFRVKAYWTASGTKVERGLIFRRDSSGGLLEAARDVEFHAYQALHAAGFPVPEALYLETDGKWFERPFFVMEEVLDCTAASALSPDLPYGKNAGKVGEQFFSVLGRLAKTDPASLPGLYACLDKVDPENVWRKQLDYWEKEIDEDTLTPQTVLKAGTRWLRANPPPPPQKLCIVHGDYRSGNFLYDTEGDIKAILDWEMVHIGDPLEDFGWATDPVWAGSDGTVGKMVMLDEAIRIWEKASGLRVDKQAFKWWRLFNFIKGAAIWLSAGAEYAAKRNTNPILVFPAWAAADAHNRLIIQFLLDEYQTRGATA